MATFEQKRDVVRERYPIPSLFEPRHGLGLFRRDPKKFFPDDVASRWMLSLLAAAHDIGLSLKMVTPFMVSPNLKKKFSRQYRFSHLFYFWRLWLSHSHEAWLMFNRPVRHPIVEAVKAAPEVRRAFEEVCRTRGRAIVRGLTAGDLMEKCRNITFHYDERDGDKWRSQLRSIPRRFPLCIVDGEGKDVDARWLIADEYLLSRLNRIKFSSRRLHRTTSRLTHQINGLIRVCQKAYFSERDGRLGQRLGG
ncbi:MAG: hypothetical protein HYZ75_04510 [Elusimicrobia bacterium]|nr:hypothetical protein [Elusimicrobiota bacterium]